MSRHKGIATGVAVVVMIAGAGGVTTAAGPMHGRVHGMVCDAAGRGLADASVLAVGQTIVSVRSDLAGRYSLLLPPGDYVLRATRDGYVSTYREPVRIQGSALLERTITLVRQDLNVVDPNHAHTEMAWRLRHLPRGVLRDGQDWTNTAGRASALPAFDNLSGQVNLLTTGVATPPSAWIPSSLPRGVAFVEFGAPVIGHGSWTLRAALASGTGRTWNVFGEYEADANRLHSWKMRVSYSTQGFTRAPEGAAMSSTDVRSVAGVAGDDRWEFAPGMELAYGGRAERFDYLVHPHLFSVHAGLSAEILPLMLMRVRVAQNMIAPGADEFLPPPTGGAWLPVEHMFEPLSSRRALRAERLRVADVTLAYRLRENTHWPTLHVRAFSQQANDQMATLFGTENEAEPGPYFIAPVGAVNVLGFGVGASAQFSPNISGQIEYTRVMSDWDQDARVRAVRRMSPSVLRSTEDLHDVTATLDATVPRSSTRISVAYRASTGFSGQRLEPGLAARFHVQVHQALPFKPTRKSQVELMFSLRNMFRDINGDASWYDELLTVAPPLRFVGGLQIRF
jgi:hypothetical protein